MRVESTPYGNVFQCDCGSYDVGVFLIENDLTIHCTECDEISEFKRQYAKVFCEVK